MAKNSKNIIEQDVLLLFLPRVVATLYTIDDNDASHQDDHKLDKLEGIEKNVRGLENNMENQSSKNSELRSSFHL